MSNRVLPPWLPSVAPGTPPDVLDLWCIPRLEVENIYTEAYKRDDRQALRWLAKNDRYFLLSCLLRRPDVRHDWIFERIREVQADKDSYVDLWARDHYKSTIITFAGVIEEILNDAEITIGIFSHDRPTAKAFLNQIKLEFEENEQLIALFPEIFWENPKKEAPKWSLDDGICVQRKSNPKEQTVEAWGVVDGMPTSKHFKLRDYDDLITEENVTNPEMIRKTTDRWELSQNLGTRDGREWYVGTRYHFGDTYGIMTGSRGYRERRRPATHDGSFDGKPVFLTQEQWDNKKRQSSKSTIASQQLLNPLAGSETTFDVTKLGFWEVRPRTLSIYILVDPSKGRYAKSDETAIAVIGVDANRMKYLIDGWRHRMPLSVRWKMLSTIYFRYLMQPGVVSVEVGYEQYGMQTDIEYFQEQMLRTDKPFPIEELNWPRQGENSKQQRIERLEPDFRTQRLLLPKTVKIDEEGRIEPFDARETKRGQEAIKAGQPWRVATPLHKKNEDNAIYDTISVFLEEFMFFPFAPRDDFLDACSRIYDMDPTPPVPYTDAPGGENTTEPEVFVDGT